MDMGLDVSLHFTLFTQQNLGCVSVDNSHRAQPGVHTIQAAHGDLKLRAHSPTLIAGLAGANCAD